MSRPIAAAFSASPRRFIASISPSVKAWPLCSCAPVASAAPSQPIPASSAAPPPTKKASAPPGDATRAPRDRRCEPLGLGPQHAPRNPTAQPAGHGSAAHADAPSDRAPGLARPSLARRPAPQESAPRSRWPPRAAPASPPSTTSRSNTSPTAYPRSHRVSTSRPKSPLDPLMRARYEAGDDTETILNRET